MKDFSEEHALQAPDAPLDILGAESEGQIGYLLETALSEALPNCEVEHLPFHAVVKAGIV